MDMESGFINKGCKECEKIGNEGKVFAVRKTLSLLSAYHPYSEDSLFGTVGLRTTLGYVVSENLIEGLFFIGYFGLISNNIESVGAINFLRRF